MTMRTPKYLTSEYWSDVLDLLVSDDPAERAWPGRTIAGAIKWETPDRHGFMREAERRGLSAEELREELILDGLDKTLERVWRIITHHPSVGKGEKRGSSEELVPFDAFLVDCGACSHPTGTDDFTLGDFELMEAGMSRFMSWFERDVLNNIDRVFNQAIYDPSVTAISFDQPLPDGRTRGETITSEDVDQSRTNEEAVEMINALIDALKNPDLRERVKASVDQHLADPTVPVPPADKMVLRRSADGGASRRKRRDDNGCQRDRLDPGPAVEAVT